MNETDDAAARMGRAIQLRRVELGLRRRDLAEKAGLSYPYISEIENGIKEPSAKAMRQIASALDFTVAELDMLGSRLGEREEEGGESTTLLPLRHHRLEPVVPMAAFAVPHEVAPRSAAVGLGREVPSGVDPELTRLVREIVREEIDVWASTRLRRVVQEIVRSLDEELDPERR